MKSALAVITFAAIATLLVTLTCSAQTYVTAGTPPFGSFSGGPDIIDNANLNVHYTIPILHKAGRGTDFSYSLGYDSSFWYQVNNGSKIVWLPVPTWGWSQGLAGGGAYVLYSIAYQSASCGPPGYGYSYDEWTFSNFTFYDSVGTPHEFGASATYIQDNGGTLGCPTPGSSDPNGIVAQADVYTISLGPAGAGSISMNSLQGPSGGGINVPFVTTPPGLSVPIASLTDRNGNEISISSGVYEDTLGTTALTIAHGTTTTYSYTAPSGGTATYTVSYQTYTVRTNFGCSGTSEFGPTSESLVNKITLPDGSYYQFTYEATPGYSGDVTGRPASVRLPTGGTISYTYTGANNGIVCSGDGINSTAGLKRSTPDTGSGYWTYARTIGTYPNPDTTTITDPQGNQTVVTFPEYSLDETQRVVNQGSSTALEMITTAYQSGSYPVIQKTVTTCWPNASSSCPSGSGTLQSKAVTSYNSSELVTEVDEYAYGTGAPGSLARKTLTSYAPLGSIIDMPASVTVEDASSNITAQTTYCYDEATPSGSTTCGATGPPTATVGTPQHINVGNQRGNATTTNSLVSGSTYVSQTLTYFDTGNVNVAKDMKGNQTTYTYSNSTSTCGNTFPTTITFPSPNVPIVRSYTWNCTGAVLTQLTDENSQNTTTTYSDQYFWRPANQSFPDGGETSWGYATTSLTTTTKMNSSQNVVSTLELDGLGRQKETQLNSDPQGVDYVDTTYDALGRVSSTSNPYRSTNDPTYGLTKYLYDALSRPTSATLPDNSVATASYSTNIVTATDPASKARTAVYDAQGRLVQVFEDPGSSPHLNYQTNYTYDTLDNLVGVLQGGRQLCQIGTSYYSRCFAYNSLKQLTQSTNPESGTICYGTLSGSTCQQNGYDANGNLVYQTDARGIRTTYTYDSLNRITGVTYSSNGNPVSYTYDQSACLGESSCYNVGHRTTMADGDGSESLAYDKMGRELVEKRITNSITKSTTYTYDLAGDLATLVYPSGRTITYTYDSAGRPSDAVDTANSINYAVGSCSNGASSPTTGVCYGPLGAITQIQNGTNLVSTYLFNTLLQPCWLYATTGTALATNTACSGTATTGNILDLKYNFNLGSTDNGNVIGITNNRDSTRTQSFTYDPVNRIATGAGSTYAQSSAHCWGETYSYDQWSNLTAIGAISSAYTGCVQDSLSVSATANNQLSSTGFSYDAAGNMLTDNVNTYTFNAAGEIATAAGVTYQYDGDGNRVQKSSGKIYWHGAGAEILDESDLSGNLTNEYVSFGGKRIAMRNVSSGAIYYYELDMLGSSRTLVQAGQTSPCYDADFRPFGSELAITNTCSQNYKFTGQERDSESGLDNFQARFYSSRLGRFMSPDPENIGADPTNPQSWNMYSYVLNNPLRYLDPTGLYCVDGDGDEITDDDGTPIYDNQSDCESLDGGGGYWITADEQDSQSTTVTVTATFDTQTDDNGDDEGFDGQSGGSPGILGKLKSLVCSALPQGQALTAGGMVGGVGGVGYAVNLVTNYNTGQTTLSATGSVQWIGWNGGASSSVTGGLIYSSSQFSNSAYSGKFNTLSVSSPAGPGGFVSRGGDVTVVGASLGGSAIPTYTGGASTSLTSRQWGSSALSIAALVLLPGVAESTLANVACKAQ